MNISLINNKEIKKSMSKCTTVPLPQTSVESALLSMNFCLLLKVHLVAFCLLCCPSSWTYTRSGVNVVLRYKIF